MKASVFSFAILAVLYSFFSSYPRGSVAGDIRATGAPHGDFVVQPVTCFSGGHWGFDGVWVVTEIQKIDDRRGFKGGLKILKNDTGKWEAYVENPNICQGFKCQQWQVEKHRCQIFDVSVSDKNVWRRCSGHASLDCSFPEGGTLIAKLTFDGCTGAPPYDSGPEGVD